MYACLLQTYTEMLCIAMLPVIFLREVVCLLRKFKMNWEGDSVFVISLTLPRTTIRLERKLWSILGFELSRNQRQSF